MNPMGNLAADARSLDALKSQAARDPQQAVRSAAAQFEALFMRQLLKSMRDAMPKSGMWDSPGQSMYVDMFDQQMAQSMSGRAGGLADVIARQLSAHVRGGVKPGDIAPGLAREAQAAAGAATPASGATAAAASTVGPSQRATHGATPAAMPGATDQVRAARYAAALAAARVAALAGETGTETVAPNPMSSFPHAAGAPLRFESFQLGAVAGAQAPSLQGMSATQADFVRRMWPQALSAQRATGVPAEFIVGQAALESGWGRSEIRNADGSRSHNLFGIKATGGWEGAVADASTTEYVGGRANRQVERFRSYGSYAEAFNDWATLVANSPRYGQVARTGASAGQFAQGMQRAGYATDPNYGEKLERVINQTLAIRRLVI
ncbi:MAG: flagellar assembly peptidoglycan hydrolase FlgJ [Burkholderiaceae bacterium]|nr:flagellar assembly peptidoglycan hydrolase FlgJ [Burkholderiaceae bacterium]